VDLSVYIKELLYKHNCVIIPGFGAFVANYSPASINAVSDSFDPPSKDIMFNPGIVRNDGLLADYLSQKTNISYDEALLILKDSVADLKLSLNKGKTVNFTAIGNFSVNKEGKYIFQPDNSTNLLLESFGMSVFNSPAIRREGIAKGIERKIREKDISREIRIPAAVKWVAAASITILVLISMAVLNPGVIEKINFNYSSIYNSLVSRLYNNDFENSPAIKPETIKPLAVAAETKQVNADSIAAADLTAENKAETVQAETVRNPEYYIVGGCFSIEENAEKFLKELKSKGYDASLVGVTKTGLFRVAYSGFSNAEDANSQLEKLRNSEDADVWLLHYHNNQ
jgi:nucleoid DNA-binding protein